MARNPAGEFIRQGSRSGPRRLRQGQVFNLLGERIRPYKKQKTPLTRGFLQEPDQALRLVPRPGFFLVCKRCENTACRSSEAPPSSRLSLSSM